MNRTFDDVKDSFTLFIYLFSAQKERYISIIRTNKKKSEQVNGLKQMKDT